ncbi:hypothetical protein F4680DRAFT_450484 [Xylaria scruposa]|nr:hypothetical protein F4680DRAFT_450484 [Xylaria scruposa]
MRYWFKKPEPILGGEAKKFLDDKNVLTEMTRDGRAKIGRFNDRAISPMTSAIAICIAAFLLAGSITGFYFVESDVVKLVLDNHLHLRLRAESSCADHEPATTRDLCCLPLPRK